MVNLKCLFGYHKYKFYGWMKLCEEIKKQNVDINLPIHRCKRCMRLVSGMELPPKPWPIYVSKDDKIEVLPNECRCYPAPKTLTPDGRCGVCGKDFYVKG